MTQRKQTVRGEPRCSRTSTYGRMMSHSPSFISLGYPVVCEHRSSIHLLYDILSLDHSIEHRATGSTSGQIDRPNRREVLSVQLIVKWRLSKEHASQLYRYFSVTEARFGV